MRKLLKRDVYKRQKQAFEKVKELTIRLSMVENAAYRLAANIKKTQKRANALKNITIPHYEQLTKDISNALEEKERDCLLYTSMVFPVPKPPGTAAVPPFAIGNMVSRIR